MTALCLQRNRRQPVGRQPRARSHLIRVSFLEKLLRSKVVIWTLIILPGLWPAWPIFRHEPGRPRGSAQVTLHHLGFVACMLLAIVLALHPAARAFSAVGVALALNRHRRLVGVSAFVYGALHFATHLLYEGGFAVLASDVKTVPAHGLITLTILLRRSPSRACRPPVRWLGGKALEKSPPARLRRRRLAAYHQAAARRFSRSRCCGFSSRWRCWRWPESSSNAHPARVR